MLIAAATAVAVLLADLLIPRWVAPWAVTILGAAATAVAAVIAPVGGYSLLCAEPDRCSYTLTDRARLIALVIGALTALCMLLFTSALRAGDAPAGEVGFLMACAMTGGVVLGGAQDLLTLIVALETLTLPLYALVALHRRRASEGAGASVTFFTTSVVATAVTLLGAALLQFSSGTVHLPYALTPTEFKPLGVAGLVLLLTGLGFKVAAVPLHLWAPSTYDGAPLAVAAYLSTASKLGGVVAILIVTDATLTSDLVDTAGITVAVLATASLLVGTLVALRQERTVRLLAWSSVAQAGFILAPLGGLIGLRLPSAGAGLIAAALAYTLFFIALELAAFSGVTALRPGPLDGGVLRDLNGLGRAAPWRSALLAFALIGLAGLPPALAGLFAKITVLGALLNVRSYWLAVVVALLSIVGLAVYWRPLVALYRGTSTDTARPQWTTLIPLALATLAILALSVAPQLALTPTP
ncbi:NADH-quinone oxidoreductase subunit N [Rhizocola hellebori]|uniref:NADH-quinone oxidoreductase subunit N n=1 Tax=Rhizocola hellebori TaxID=1392758 RepID=A0A8J3QJF7_9ACTN|nr:proton-conducting transporter membrane subunit [Rhizocola hellebori]GIH10478.1 NADH-quinone oxidoreductase subunit N [Rhizocola hellebori]